ncbi:hypothetical protein ACNFBR_15730 [Pseudomonas sp. NY11955]|uniref:hypothetical protein n=1 Tax=Pseudomonas sp. NY11955 TaxID=3400363 RepID=UPI003A8C665D
MSQYEIKDPDGQIHRIEAVGHVLDSNGLTLYATGSAVVAIFPKFSWMRQVAAVVDTTDTASTDAGESTTSGEVVAPAATGE